MRFLTVTSNIYIHAPRNRSWNLDTSRDSLKSRTVINKYFLLCVWRYGIIASIIAFHSWHAKNGNICFSHVLFRYRYRQLKSEQDVEWSESAMLSLSHALRARNKSNPCPALKLCYLLKLLGTTTDGRTAEGNLCGGNLVDSDHVPGIQNHSVHH